MAVINMVNNLKELFPDYVLFLKIGNFYETYNDDAKMLSYSFGYPLVSYNKVISNLENRNIK